MLYVIAYDISSDARRDQVSRRLSAWGDRVQFSVFEVDVEHRDLPRLIDEVAAFVHPPADRLRAWRVCGGCERATLALGGHAAGSRELAWIV